MTGAKCMWQCYGDIQTHAKPGSIRQLFPTILSSMSLDSISSAPIPTAEQIRALSEETWSRCACWFQAEIVNYLLAHPKQNLVATAATRTGKTYTFFLPALYEKAGVTFIIVPLKNSLTSTVIVLSNWV